ncbi:hypothetical protein N9J26_00305 [bacterium]|nr:hypothetical protein [bacterium]
MNVIKKYNEDESTALREEIINQTVMPYLNTIFKAYPGFQSATLLVAQYWDDEANDAVHQDVILSRLETPDLNSAFKAYAEDEKDSINSSDDLPCSVTDWDFDGGIVDTTLWRWCDNGSAIPAFAAYCKEAAGQEDDLGEAYLPYAVFRKTETGIEIEIIGEKIRPWLDGVMPEREAD